MTTQSASHSNDNDDRGKRCAAGEAAARACRSRCHTRVSRCHEYTQIHVTDTEPRPQRRDPQRNRLTGSAYPTTYQGTCMVLVPYGVRTGPLWCACSRQLAVWQLRSCDVLRCNF